MKWNWYDLVQNGNAQDRNVNFYSFFSAFGIWIDERDMQEFFKLYGFVHGRVNFDDGVSARELQYALQRREELPPKVAVIEGFVHQGEAEDDRAALQAYIEAQRALHGISPYGNFSDIKDSERQLRDPALRERVVGEIAYERSQKMLERMEENATNPRPKIVRQQRGTQFTLDGGTLPHLHGLYKKIAVDVPVVKAEIDEKIKAYNAARAELDQSSSVTSGAFWANVASFGKNKAELEGKVCTARAAVVAMKTELDRACPLQWDAMNQLLYGGAEHDLYDSVNRQLTTTDHIHNDVWPRPPGTPEYVDVPVLGKVIGEAEEGIRKAQLELQRCTQAAQRLETMPYMQARDFKQIDDDVCTATAARLTEAEVNVRASEQYRDGLLAIRTAWERAVPLLHTELDGLVENESPETLKARAEGIKKAYDKAKDALKLFFPEQRYR